MRFRIAGRAGEIPPFFFANFTAGRIRSGCREGLRNVSSACRRSSIRCIISVTRQRKRIDFEPLNVPIRFRIKGEQVNLKDYSAQNKKAWEFDAYAFWIRHAGTPEERAAEDVKDPLKMLRRHAQYFDSFKGVRIANICGSCGKKAVPLALLGADVTVFDISEANKRYALEVAEAAGTQIEYVVGDVLEIDTDRYSDWFDVVFMEGGVLHYFHDIDEFMRIMHAILKPGGRIICSDFHPFTKISDSLNFQMPAMSYFSTEIFEGEMAHARFYDEEIRKTFPKCSYRKYTISEILNAMIRSGFTIRRFDEHPSWKNEDLPGEFTAVGVKEAGGEE